MYHYAQLIVVHYASLCTTKQKTRLNSETTSLCDFFFFRSIVSTSNRTTTVCITPFRPCRPFRESRLQTYCQTTAERTSFVSLLRILAAARLRSEFCLLFDGFDTFFLKFLLQFVCVRSLSPHMIPCAPVSVQIERRERLCPDVC